MHQLSLLQTMDRFATLCPWGSDFSGILWKRCVTLRLGSGKDCASSLITGFGHRNHGWRCSEVLFETSFWELAVVLRHKCPAASKCWTVVSGLPAFSAGTFTTIPSTDVTVKPCNNWNVSVYVMRQWFAEMADFFTKCCRFSFPLLPDHFAVSKSDSLWSPVSWFGQCWQGNQNIYFLFHCMSRERMTWFTDQTLYYSDHC